MRESRPKLLGGRHFRDEVIGLCVRWYLRYPLSYRNLEEMMAERGLAVDHSAIARWVLNALLAILLACGLRRHEIAELTVDHLQQREQHRAIVDFAGRAATFEQLRYPIGSTAR